MSGENKFWLGVWVIAGVVLSVLIACITTFRVDHNAKIVEMVKGGVDPVAAICALQDDYGTSPTCLVLAAKKD